MKLERLTELEALCAQATAGPWGWNYPDIDRLTRPTGMPDGPLNYYGLEPAVLTTGSTCGCVDGCQPESFQFAREEDALFCVGARTGLPEALAELRRLGAGPSRTDERLEALAQRWADEGEEGFNSTAGRFSRELREVLDAE